MSTRDPRIDAYIVKAKPFAQPILQHLRALVHQANPDVTETTKWGMPFFDYKGPYCHMAAFKEHAVFGFWKYQILKDPTGHLEPIKAEGGSSMGNFGKITSLQSLPPDEVILEFLRQASQINDKGITVPVEKRTKKPLETPGYFDEALTAHPKAREAFDAFPPSAQRDYITWLTDAKTEATREKRLRTAIDWISEGKRRNWKYEKK